ncbi:hypothetical protein [Denitrobaculum tricleocarpae]|uniref:Uncharacterized protein n=1 Tax=Denitrobaculum tricleocarpae TaxID=2591009 RepID=A0A545T5E9_9PROT|nr:hypothetical protein [Denitrobaculum tricleocarpae]TQV72461.1 hypothetical protein FKG95_25655 [Denitrobaculum tricleocarpae]
MKEIALRHVAKIPPPPKGFKFVSVSVSLQGAAQLLYIETKAESLVHRQTESDGFAVFPVPDMGAAFRYRLVTTGGENSREIDFPPFEFAFPMVDVFADGSAAIVGSRCRWRSKDDYDVNGMIVDRATGQEIRFLAGDGVQDIGVDGSDRLWISYFDEGVYGNFGWGNLDPNGERTPAPVGASGLNCFDRRGDIVWQHDQEQQFIDDCYALNVTRDVTHFYFYSDFDLGHVSSDFTALYRKTDIRGAHAFAISPDRVLFSGQYDDPPDRVYLLSLQGDESAKSRTGRLLLPAGKIPKDVTLIGRGSSLHLFTRKDWYRVTLEEIE